MVCPNGSMIVNQRKSIGHKYKKPLLGANNLGLMRGANEYTNWQVRKN